MANFFGFGAFSTQVGQMIERATDNAASAGNLAFHLQICDTINDSDNGPKDAVSAIKKRLTGSAKNFHIINLTLTVLETCMKNCTIRFHSKVCQRDFLKELINVISPKNNPPTIVRERVLGLIQYWADAFKNKPQLVAVVELYEFLKAEGTEFPPVDLDNFAPVSTPEQRTLTAPPQPSAPPTASGLHIVQPAQQPQPNRQYTAPSAPVGPLKPEQVAKLLSELDVVRRNLDVMNELLIENEPGKESEDDFQLMKELHTVTESMQERVTGLIGRVSDEIVLESLLQINDELNTSFTRYDRHMKNRQAVKEGVAPETSFQEGPPPHEPLVVPPVEAPSISYPSLDNPPAYTSSEPVVAQLIDFGSETSTQANTEGVAEPVPTGDVLQQLASIGIGDPPSSSTNGDTAPQLNTQQSDEFDMFAQSRMAYSSSGWSSTYDDNKVQQDQGSLASVVHRQPDPPRNTELIGKAWEGPSHTDPTTTEPSTAGNEDQVTSAEFDQFLAQRASKSRPRHQMQQQGRETTDDLFQL